MDIFERFVDFFYSQLNNNEFFSGAFLATALGSAFYSLKGVPIQLWNRIQRHLIYRTSIYQTSDIYLALELYLSKHYTKKYRNVEAVAEYEVVGNNSMEVDMANTEGEGVIKRGVRYFHFEDRFLIWHNGVPMYIKKGREKLENASSLKSAFLSSFTMSTFFGKKRVNSFIEKVFNEYCDEKEEKKETYIYINSYHHWDRVTSCDRSMDSVILKKGVKEKLLDDIEEFKSNEEKYKRLDIPYKRTYCLEGVPGNGKTSVASAMATLLKMNLCYLNLTTVKDDESLQALFRNLPNNSLLLVEDIDASFKGRKPLGEVSMSCLLNCLDGVFYRDGLVTVITTNHIGKLDAALTRRGRMDLILTLENPNKEQVEDYVRLFFNTNEVEIPRYTPNKSMSDVVEVCISNNLNDTISTLSDV